jgi:sensor c-di-GMP phosphodiesterase-like protein
MSQPEAEAPITLDSMRAGLANGEFFLEYLPVIALNDGRCVGAETLIRWRRASGVIGPDEFIPVIENTPLSGVLTYWVVDTMASELADWLRANPESYISINVPPEILGRGGIEHAAGKAGLLDLASQLVFEVTERGVPDALGVAAINGAIEHGIRVALDDVTLSGPANLAVLARCNFHIVKLDRSLIWEIQPDCPHPPWLEEVGALLQISQMTVIAEGIETPQQRAALESSNVQFGQGFHFSRPLAAEAFMEFHRRAGTDG